MENKIEQASIQHVEVFFNKAYLQIKAMSTDPNQELMYAFYVYKTGEVDAIEKSAYKKFDTHQLEITAPGEYRVKVFAKNKNTGKVMTQSSKAVQYTMIKDY
ncbi:hypothetical protein HCA63_05700 [Listeria booriae]|uniref:Two component regulator three Y domain-containing protein n=1 Tax=Listeria booriae TaxID=1552123 RepID=A0A7X0YZT3_9LIST|nr:hypothetical protein [Listeria booriae]MBC1231302.1 hypothetical protein [Listeria booriae]MBC1512260.1 hypothetical protein [Listeria booriae]MBC1551293.1 hypothetical protein [Listeria booriae]MBC1559146.1 hypothetical protein [Listeria booriae]MBC1566073.1 hypothetical protein [Listeria booriae]